MRTLIILFCIATLPFAATESHALSDEVKSSIVLDPLSGKVVFAHNENKALPPASMTKIMTMLLIFEGIERKEIAWEDIVTTSELAASQGGSQIFLKAGEEMSVRDMVKGIAVASANDAAVAMAEHLSGNEEAFIKKMNERAEELGLVSSTFKNVTGLPEEGHVSSAADMARMASELLKHQEVTAFTGIYEDYLRKDTDDPFWLVNTNKLVRFFKGADGLKTGYTSDALFCLTATAKRGDTRLVAVVFGAKSAKERNEIVTRLLSEAFQTYSSKTIYKEGTPVASVSVDKGEDTHVSGILKQPLTHLESQKSPEDKLKMKIRQKPLQAPVSKGQVIGDATVMEDGKAYHSVPIVAEGDVGKAGWTDYWLRSIGKMLGAAR